MVEDESGNNAKDLPPRGLLVTGRLGASVMFDTVLRSVHHHRQKAQTRKSRSSKEAGIYQASAPISGTQLRAGGEASLDTGLTGYRQSVEAHADAPDAPAVIGFGDMFDMEFMDPYEYIMSTDPSLMIDNLEAPGSRTW
jgi:hypothetical protein